MNKQETLEEFAHREALIFFANGGSFTNLIILGAKWQQERDKDFYFKYIKSEKDFQIPRMANLGINTTGQMFEQMITSLIHLGERSYSEEEVLTIINDWEEQNAMKEFIEEWFEKFKKK